MEINIAEALAAWRLLMLCMLIGAAGLGLIVFFYLHTTGG